MSAEIYFIKEEPAWPDLDHLIRRCVNAALHSANYEQSAALSVVLAHDDFVQDLNKRYRGQDKPTNVLSFPQNDEMMDNLGDIIFALETVQREAAAQDKKFKDHVAHLAVHGTLHLLGYDHERDEDAEHMESLEIQILEGLNISNPYA